VAEPEQRPWGNESASIRQAGQPDPVGADAIESTGGLPRADRSQTIQSGYAPELRHGLSLFPERISRSKAQRDQQGGDHGLAFTPAEGARLVRELPEPDDQRHQVLLRAVVETTARRIRFAQGEGAASATQHPECGRGVAPI